MFKRIEFDFLNSQGEQTVQLIDTQHAQLIKTAGISSELQYAIDELKPNEKKVYVLVNALGAGEWWGSNKNGDYFPDESLQKYAKTFESGHVFKHHVNKDPSKACGKVVFAHYNDDMKRVELLLEVDKAQAGEIVEKLATNSNVPVSMGCRVPYDVCSICGNKAAKKAEYCGHITKELNKVAENGKKACMINTRPRFFDISFVRVPADRTAYVMQSIEPNGSSDSWSLKESQEINIWETKNAMQEKIAEIKLSVDLGEEWLKTNQLKESDLDKKITQTVETTVLSQKDEKLYIPENLPGNLPKTWLDETIKKGSASEILSTFAYSRIYPTPKDFQYILLKTAGFVKDAENYYQNNITFNPNQFIHQFSKVGIPEDWGFDAVADSVIRQCEKVAHSHVLTPPRILARELEKTGFFGQPPITSELQGFVGSPARPIQDKSPLTTQTSYGTVGEQTAQNPFMPRNPLLSMGVIGGLYYGFHKLFNKLTLTNPENLMGLEGAVMHKPWLLPVLIGGAAFGAVQAQRLINDNSSRYTFTKTADSHWVKRLLVTVPASYIYSGYVQTKVDRGKSINTLEDKIRRHPAITGALAFGLSGPVLNKSISALEKFSADLFLELEENSFQEFYEEIVK